MFAHTCSCIWCSWLSGFAWKLKTLKISFVNENSFEVKEKKIRKSKYFKSCKNLFLKTNQNFSFLFELKSIFKILFEFDEGSYLHLDWKKCKRVSLLLSPSISFQPRLQASPTLPLFPQPSCAQAQPARWRSAQPPFIPSPWPSFSSGFPARPAHPMPWPIPIHAA